jgi:ABC-2 type transport system ATP-binding protein
MSIVTLQNIKKQYNGTYVLKNINLNFEAGKITGYLGPNGAGKSTTIKILTGIITEFEGEATLFDLDLRKDNLAIKRRIGYIPELAHLYDVLTPIEYLLFIGKLYELPEKQILDKSHELLKLFDLQDRMHSTMSDFSKGMKQKVLIISGLLHNPEIIFLDEPLSGLDANAVIMVKEILLQLKNAGKTIIYSSHLMDIVEKISDTVIILNKGEVIAQGSIASLKEQAHQGSLEQIFSELTNNENNNQDLAGQFVNVINY